MSRMEELPLLVNEDTDVTEGHASEFQDGAERQTNNEPNERSNDNKDFKYDVFISYSASDRPWVRDVLLHTLEQEDKKVCIDYRDFQPGVPITDNVVQAIEDSQVTVLVLTPAFVESEWCMFESKHALISSLATSKARVLPLILMECDIPNILKHLTYLDHTSEDVQPYFKEQLIVSLNNAEKWIPPDNHGSDIVPLSEVQQVVNRSMDQEKKRETAINKLMGAFSSFGLLIRRIKICIACPCILGLVAFFVVGVLVICLMAVQKFQIIPLKPTSVNSTATHVFFSLKIKASLAKKCELRTFKNAYSQEPVLVDTFGFEDFSSKVLFGKENTTNLVASLPPNKMIKQKRFRIYGEMSVTTKFCFRSQTPGQNASLRLYKPTSTSEVNLFGRISYPWDIDISRVKHNDYISIRSELFCSTSLIKGQSLTSDEFSAFVFQNVGKTPLFLNLTTTSKTPNIKKSLASLTCLNSSTCQLPSSHRIRYIIVSKNISTPADYDADEISVKCVYKLPVLLSSIAFVAIFFGGIFFLWLCIKVVNKKCVPRWKRWYFGSGIVREKLGEAAVQMIEDSPNLEELAKTINRERENKVFTI